MALKGKIPHIEPELISRVICFCPKHRDVFENWMYYTGDQRIPWVICDKCKMMMNRNQDMRNAQARRRYKELKNGREAAQDCCVG